MKKDIEWLVQTINAERETLRQRIETGRGTPNENTFNEGRDRALAYVLRMIQHLDKPEALTMGLPVIPKYVDEYIKLSKNNISLKQVLEKAIRRDEWITWIKAYSWISANDEMFARAWLDGYMVEEEQKYYVDLDEAAYVAKWNGNDHVDIYSDSIAGSDELEFHLTEEEIKDFDERFWPFAEPVE